MHLKNSKFTQQINKSIKIINYQYNDEIKKINTIVISIFNY